MELIETWHGRRRRCPDDAGRRQHRAPPTRSRTPTLSEERRAMLQAFLDIARGHLELERRATVDDFLSSLRADDRVGATSPTASSSARSTRPRAWSGRSCTSSASRTATSRSASPTSAAARAEEQRLLYVAATRAERELHVSWSESRVIGDQLVEREPSPWIDAFHGEADPLPDERPSIANLRAKIAAVPEVDLTITDQHEREIVRDQLLIWREDWADQGADHRAHRRAVGSHGRGARRPSVRVAWTNSPTSRASGRARRAASG